MYAAGWPLAMLAAFAVAYPPVFQKLFHHWNGEDNSYCYLVIPVVCYLLWEERQHFRFQEFSFSRLGPLVAGVGVLLLLMGEFGSVETLLYAGLWGGLASVAFTLYGSRARRLWFPLLVLFFIVPLPPMINRVLTFKLKLLASKLSAVMLGAAGVSVYLDGNIIDLGSQQLQVVDACSGLRYVISMALMALLIGHFFAPGWWRRLLLLGLVAPVTVVANGCRIFFTGLLVTHGYGEYAENLSHDAAGLVIFLLAGGLLYGTARVLRRLGPPAAAPVGLDAGAGVVLRRRAIGLTVAVSLLFLGSGWVLQGIPSAANLPARATLLTGFPMQVGDWQGERHFLDPKILDSLWADDYVDATFTRPGSRNMIYLLIPFYEYQSTQHTAHAPQSCLLGGGWAILTEQELPVTVAPGRTIRPATMLLAKEESRLLASYFFLQRGRVITSPWANKFYLMWDSFARHRTDGALVRVELLLTPGQTELEARQELGAFMMLLWRELPAYIPE